MASGRGEESATAEREDRTRVRCELTTRGEGEEQSGKEGPSHPARPGTHHRRRLVRTALPPAAPARPRRRPHSAACDQRQRAREGSRVSSERRARAHGKEGVKRALRRPSTTRRASIMTVYRREATPARQYRRNNTGENAKQVGRFCQGAVREAAPGIGRYSFSAHTRSVRDVTRPRG